MMNLTLLLRNWLSNVIFIGGYIVISFLLAACNQGAVRPEYAGGADYDTQRKGLPANYSADAIEGRVMDAGTGQPLEGAIVIALWELERPYSMEGPIPSGHMQVTEVLTDSEGRYVIPAWGPKPRPGEAYLGPNDPFLVVFKEDYDYLLLTQSYLRVTDDRRYEEKHNSSWDGKTVELKKFEGDLEAYYARLRRLAGVLDTLFAPVFGAGACDWQKIPQMMFSFDRYDYLLEQANIPHSLIPSIDTQIAQGSCGTKEEFIRKFKA